MKYYDLHSNLKIKWIKKRIKSNNKDKDKDKNKEEFFNKKRKAKMKKDEEEVFANIIYSFIKAVTFNFFNMIIKFNVNLLK